MSNIKRLVFFAVFVLLTAGIASASNFRAADIVYLPGVARAPGGAGAFFKTDVVISNLSTERVVVQVAYIPTGAQNNNSNRVEITLPTFAPNERRDIADVVDALGIGTVDANGVRTAFGYLIFFSCKENGNCNACDTNPADCELISVQGRIYNSQSSGATFGQLFPGIPWYNYVSINSADRQLDKVQIAGLRQVGQAGVSGFRSNIGLVNASEFSSTVLRVRLFSPTGTALGTFDQALTPLAHIQLQLPQMFSSFNGQGYVTVEQVSVTAAPGETDTNPGFLAYGSVVDNISGDPTTLETQYLVEMPFDCIYGAKPQKRLVKR